MSPNEQTLPNVDIIPQELKKLKQWVLWKRELRGDNPKPTKVPYSAIELGVRANSVDPKTWSIFDDAYAQYIISNDNEKKETFKELGIYQSYYQGVGFVLTENDEYVAWDFDNCIEDNQVLEPVASYVKTLDSYTEISPSGKGLRIIVCGKLPKHGRKSGPFETYESGRFVTITGNHFTNTPRGIEYRQDQIDSVHELIFGKQEPENSNFTQGSITLIPEDTDLLSKARNAKNGIKFKMLYDEGDIADHPSPSEARFALLGMLCFYTGPTDKERLDRLFRQSALYDSKWDNKRNSGTVGSEAIDSILAKQQVFYSSGTNNSFFIKNNKTYFHGKEGEEEVLCNFNLIPKGRLYKQETNKSILLADLICGDGEIHAVEIDAAASDSLSKIKQNITNWPWDTQCFKTQLWAAYMDWIKDLCPTVKLKEVSYYGVLNVESEKSTLLLPTKDHNSYVWIKRNSKNTAESTFFVEKDEDKYKEYLTGLSENLPGYHSDTFIYPLLGWLCACPVSAFLRHYVSGFPTCMIYGTHGSAKSAVLKLFGANHFGARYNSFHGSTIFSIRKFLVSNNVCPFIIDDYSEKNEQHTVALTEVNKNLWDASETNSGRQSGEVVTDRYVAPMLMAGELHYEDDPAAVDRTFSIRVDKTHLDYVYNASEEEKQLIENKINWVCKNKWKGILGNILINWVESNLQDIPDIIKVAKDLVHSRTKNIRNERKIEGYISVVTGILILREVYKDYGLKLNGFLNLNLCLGCIIDESVAIETQGQTNNLPLKILFKVTDKLIVDNFILGRSLQPFLYTIDPDNCNIAYFDALRWQSYISKNIKSNSTASLSNATAFIELIKDRVRQKDTPIIDFGDSKELLTKNCITVDLAKIKEQFGVNTEIWRNITNGE